MDVYFIFQDIILAGLMIALHNNLHVITHIYLVLLFKIHKLFIERFSNPNLDMSRSLLSSSQMEYHSLIITYYTIIFAGVTFCLSSTKSFHLLRSA
uniref:Uncharacterized protein n=1 Tax=Onchocerca volvulus TaxID=6282 RepID=A0A8R1U3I5_ONCVO